MSPIRILALLIVAAQLVACAPGNERSNKRNLVIGVQLEGTDSLNRARNKRSDCLLEPNADSLRLQISWGPGTCMAGKVASGCRKSIKPAFTIHGLWPTRTNLDSPHNCCTTKSFQLNTLAPLYRDLKVHWPSLGSMSDEGFWPYEWRKHGTCAGRIKGIADLVDYFKFALDEFKKLNLLQELTNLGYEPGHEKYYRGSDMIDDLWHVLGYRVMLDCAASRGRTILTGLAVCFDTKLQPVNCKYNRSACKRDLLFPKSYN